MKLKELPAVIASLAALVTSIAGLVTATQAKDDSGVVYQRAAEGVADNADELYQLRERLAKLENKEISLNGN